MNADLMFDALAFLRRAQLDRCRAVSLAWRDFIRRHYAKFPLEMVEKIEMYVGILEDEIHTPIPMDKVAERLERREFLARESHLYIGIPHDSEYEIDLKLISDDEDEREIKIDRYRAHGIEFRERRNHAVFERFENYVERLSSIWTNNILYIHIHPVAHIRYYYSSCKEDYLNADYFSAYHHTCQRDDFITEPLLRLFGENDERICERFFANARRVHICTNKAKPVKYSHLGYWGDRSIQIEHFTQLGTLRELEFYAASVQSVESLASLLRWGDSADSSTPRQLKLWTTVDFISKEWHRVTERLKEDFLSAAHPQRSYHCRLVVYSKKPYHDEAQLFAELGQASSEEVIWVNTKSGESLAIKFDSMGAQRREPTFSIRRNLL